MLVLPIATAPVAPVVLLSPIPTTSIVPVPLPPIVKLVTALSPPIVPCIVTEPDPPVITSASLCPLVPSIVPSIRIFPAPLPPSSVSIVVVPALLRTMFPPSNVRLSFFVLILGDTPVSNMVSPVAASYTVTPSVL